MRCHSYKKKDFWGEISKNLSEWKDSFEEIENSKWYVVKVGSREDMYVAPTYKSYIMLYFPMINYYPYIIRHGHYLVGYKYDDKGKVKYIVYGIPGTKDQYDQPYGGEYGFVSWTQPRKNKGIHGDIGYWLMFYDYKKSVIVVPARN